MTYSLASNLCLESTFYSETFQYINVPARDEEIVKENAYIHHMHYPKTVFPVMTRRRIQEQ